LEVAGLAAEDVAPEEGRLRGEDVAGGAVDDEPGFLGEFAVELAGTPAGVAGEEADLADLERGRIGETDEGEVAADGRIAGGAGSEAEDGFGGDGAAAEEGGGRAQQWGPGGEIIVRVDIQGAVEDDAEGTVRAMVADQDDAALEVGVLEQRAGDEQVSGGRLQHGQMMAEGARAVANEVARHPMRVALTVAEFGSAQVSG